MSGKKLISFCITGRNDNYTGNFKYRINTAVNYLAWSAKYIGLLEKIEIVITDWNSETPLDESLELSAEAILITKFISVLPKVACNYHHQYDGQKFNTTCALNAGIKRATGSYVAIMPSDCFFGPAALENFMKVLCGEITILYDISSCLLKISRKMIPYNIWQNEPSIEDLEETLSKIGGNFLYSPDTAHDITSGLAIIAASRQLWDLARGFDERITGWGHSDTEFGLRVEQMYPSQELSHYGIWTYDLESRLDLAANNQRERQNAEIYHKNIEANTVDWGLGNENLELRQLFSNSKREQVTQHSDVSIENTYKFSNRNELISSMADVKYYDFLRVYLPFSKVLPVNWKVFYPLIWYGLTFKTSNYLEFGVSDMSGAPVVVLTNNSINLFIVSRWGDESVKHNQLSPLDIFSFLKSVDYQEGRCKFLEGDVNTALDRIETSAYSKIYYNLVLFQPDLFEDNINSLLDDIMNRLSENGAVIIKSHSTKIFFNCWEAAKKMYPTLTFIHCFENEVGVILNHAISGEYTETTESNEIKALKREWRPVKKRMTAYILFRIFDLVPGFFKKCLYEPLWRWPILLLTNYKKKINRHH